MPPGGTRSIRGGGRTPRRRGAEAESGLHRPAVAPATARRVYTAPARARSRESASRPRPAPLPRRRRRLRRPLGARRSAFRRRGATPTRGGSTGRAAARRRTSPRPSRRSGRPCGSSRASAPTRRRRSRSARRGGRASTSRSSRRTRPSRRGSASSSFRRAASGRSSAPAARTEPSRRRGTPRRPRRGRGPPPVGLRPPRRDRATALALAGAAREQGLPVSLDLCLPLVEARRDETRELLRASPSSSGTGSSWTRSSRKVPAHSPRRRSSPGASRWSSSRPARAAALVSSREWSGIVPGYAVPVVDTTGCGDAFVAGFLHALVRGAPLPRCAALGNALGAMAAGKPGSGEALPSREEVLAFLACGGDAEHLLLPLVDPSGADRGDVMTPEWKARLDSFRLARMADLFRVPKPVIGMVHCWPLPGAPGYAGGGIGPILDQARRDAEALLTGGVDGLIVENMWDLPYRAGPRLAPESIASHAVVASGVRALTRLPMGINVVHNGGTALLGIALAAGADFMRVCMFTGAGVWDAGEWDEGCAADLMRRRAELGAAGDQGLRRRRQEALGEVPRDRPPHPRRVDPLLRRRRPDRLGPDDGRRPRPREGARGAGARGRDASPHRLRGDRGERRRVPRRGRRRHRRLERQGSTAGARTRSTSSGSAASSGRREPPGSVAAAPRSAL